MWAVTPQGNKLTPHAVVLTDQCTSVTALLIILVSLVGYTKVCQQVKKLFQLLTQKIPVVRVRGLVAGYSGPAIRGRQPWTPLEGTSPYRVLLTMGTAAHQQALGLGLHLQLKATLDSH